MEGSAKGIEPDSVVNDLVHLKKAVNRIHEDFGEPALVERFIDGVELSVGILNNEILPILEIDFSTLPEELENSIHSELRRSTVIRQITYALHG